MFKAAEIKLRKLYEKYKVDDIVELERYKNKMTAQERSDLYNIKKYFSMLL